MPMDDKPIRDLYELAFMPGQFKCPKCGWLAFLVGLSYSDLAGTCACPNDGSWLEPVTYREQVEAYAARLTEELNRRDSFDAQIAELKAERDALRGAAETDEQANDVPLGHAQLSPVFRDEYPAMSKYVYTLETSVNQLRADLKGAQEGRDAASQRANDCALAHNRLYEKNRALVEALEAARKLFSEPSPFYIAKLGYPITNGDQAVIDRVFINIDAALKDNEPKETEDAL